MGGIRIGLAVVSVGDLIRKKQRNVSAVRRNNVHSGRENPKGIDKGSLFFYNNANNVMTGGEKKTKQVNTSSLKQSVILRG